MSKNQTVYRIALLVDVKQRDLPGHVLLKEILESTYPCMVKLFPAKHARRMLYNFKPHLAVLPMVYLPTYIRLSYMIKSVGSLVAFLPTEGVPVMLDDDFLDQMAGKFSDFRAIDLHLVWNEELRRREVSHGVLPSERVKVLGLPRFDFYHDSLIPLRMKKSVLANRYGLDDRKPTITWTTNFAATGLSLEEHKEGAIAAKLDQVSLFQNLEALMDNEDKSRELISQILTQWCLDNPDANIIIRPHPNEQRQHYKRLVDRLTKGGRKHIALITEEPIWDILNSTDVLIQRCCTTGVEACLMGLPVLELRLNPGEIILNPERDAAMDVVTSQEDMSDRLSYYTNGGTIPLGQVESRKRFIEKWFYVVDGRRTKKCAEMLWDLITESDIQEPTISKQETLAVRLFSILRDLQDLLMGSRTRRSSDTYMTQQEVRQWSYKIKHSNILSELQCQDTKGGES